MDRGLLGWWWLRTFFLVDFVISLKNKNALSFFNEITVDRRWVDRGLLGWWWPRTFFLVDFAISLKNKNALSFFNEITSSERWILTMSSWHSLKQFVDMMIALAHVSTGQTSLLVRCSEAYAPLPKDESYNLHLRH